MANICTTHRGEAAVSRYINSDECERCEHVEAGAKAVAVHTETDSFGPLMWYAVCEACLEESDNALSDVGCAYCKKRVPHKDMWTWRWYDFYAAQGDEPMNVCKDCWGSDAHKARIEADNREALMEHHGVHTEWELDAVLEDIAAENRRWGGHTNGIRSFKKDCPCEACKEEARYRAEEEQYRRAEEDEAGDVDYW